MTSKIARITALEILDSRGNPTLRVRVLLDDGRGRAASVREPRPAKHCRRTSSISGG
jgi:enolase